MSTSLAVQPAEIRAYGATASTVAAAISSAGAFNLAAHTAALTPVFGTIGTEFLAAFAAAQGTHAASLAELAGHFSATAVAAAATAASYASADRATAAALSVIGAA